MGQTVKVLVKSRPEHQRCAALGEHEIAAHFLVLPVVRANADDGDSFGDRVADFETGSIVGRRAIEYRNAHICIVNACDTGAVHVPEESLIVEFAMILEVLGQNDFACGHGLLDGIGEASIGSAFVE